MSKTILIAGTSSGLGRATAELFHPRGWNVVATTRSPKRESAQTRLDRVLVARLDVQDHDSIKQAVEAGIARFGRMDALVNSAGDGAYGPLEATPPEKIRRQFDVNVLGLLATTQALLPHFRVNRSGTIVNVASVAVGWHSRWARSITDRSSRSKACPRHCSTSLLRLACA